MKILVYYVATKKTLVIECKEVEAGPGGLCWIGEGRCGFVGYCADWTITILAK